MVVYGVVVFIVNGFSENEGIRYVVPVVHHKPIIHFILN